MKRVLFFLWTSIIALPMLLLQMFEHSPGIFVKEAVEVGAETALQRSWSTVGREGEAVGRATASESIRTKQAVERPTALRSGIVAEGSKIRVSDDRLLEILAKSKQIDFRLTTSNYSRIMSIAQDLENRPFSGKSIDGFAVLPLDASTFNATFGTKPNIGELEEIILFRSAFLDDFTVDIGDIPKNMNEFSQKLSQSDSNFYIITGHNKSGYLIVPPPPSEAKLKLGDMADTCQQKKKICVIISCQSKNYVPNKDGDIVSMNRRLTFLEAMEIATEIRSLIAVARRNDYSQGDVLWAMPLLVKSIERKQNISSGIKIALLPTAIVGVGGGAILLDSKNSK